MQKFVLAVHGGAGTIDPSKLTPELNIAYREGLTEACRIGHTILSKNGSALDAVEAAVSALEDFPLFNAGRGSVFTHDGTHEMDASIMDGKNSDAGAVAGIASVKNPVQLARIIMEKTPHVLFTGEGALDLARQYDLPIEPESYFFTQARYDQLQRAIAKNQIHLDHSSTSNKYLGTVGAVACDVNGNTAAATSTGGMTNKMKGRVGDTPIPGCGIWADNATCAVSCTGTGELFIRALAAAEVHYSILYRKLSLEEAVRFTVHEHLPRWNGDGGLIAVNTKREVVMDFNTDGMYRAYILEDGTCNTFIHVS